MIKPKRIIVIEDDLGQRGKISLTKPTAERLGVALICAAHKPGNGVTLRIFRSGRVAVRVGFARIPR